MGLLGISVYLRENFRVHLRKLNPEVLVSACESGWPGFKTGSIVECLSF